MCAAEHDSGMISGVRNKMQVLGLQPSARVLSFCCNPLSLQQVFQHGWKGGVSKKTPRRRLLGLRTEVLARLDVLFVHRPDCFGVLRNHVFDLDDGEGASARSSHCQGRATGRSSKGRRREEDEGSERQRKAVKGR